MAVTLSVGTGMRSRPNRDNLVLGFQRWQQEQFSSPPTPPLLLGMYYQRYKERYRLYPVSDLRDDLKHFELLLNDLLKDEPTLAPYVIEALFQIPQFAVTAPSFSNPRVISGWKLIDRATRLRRGARGEQSEFHGNTTTVGVVRV